MFNGKTANSYGDLQLKSLLDNQNPILAGTIDRKNPKICSLEKKGSFNFA
jgi:hypothetical protein